MFFLSSESACEASRAWISKRINRSRFGNHNLAMTYHRQTKDMSNIFIMFELTQKPDYHWPIGQPVYLTIRGNKIVNNWHREMLPVDRLLNATFKIIIFYLQILYRKTVTFICTGDTVVNLHIYKVTEVTISTKIGTFNNANSQPTRLILVNISCGRMLASHQNSSRIPFLFSVRFALIGGNVLSWIVLEFSCFLDYTLS